MHFRCAGPAHPFIASSMLRPAGSLMSLGVPRLTRGMATQLMKLCHRSHAAADEKALIHAAYRSVFVLYLFIVTSCMASAWRNSSCSTWLRLWCPQSQFGGLLRNKRMPAVAFRFVKHTRGIAILATLVALEFQLEGRPNLEVCCCPVRSCGGLYMYIYTDLYVHICMYLCIMCMYIHIYIYGFGGGDILSERFFQFTILQ